MVQPETAMNTQAVSIELARLAVELVQMDDESARRTIDRLKSEGLSREQVREAILQTYLFDGYPTALEGLFLLRDQWPGKAAPLEEPDFNQWETWRARGRELYQRIYGSVADRLQEVAKAAAPELAEWMVVEGYGKVLSRPGLDIRTREMVIVAILLVKGRKRQLESHIRGALRVGVPAEDLYAMLQLLRSHCKPEYRRAAWDMIDQRTSRTQ
ncbi:hypothetical protein GF324_06985 [bacterium]|nr:hypothetical protein [bacterium]